MIPCRLCSPKDVRGEQCLSNSEGKWLLGLKQVGKTKYKKNGLDYMRFYRCQDCGMRWRMIGKIGTMTFRDEPVLRIVSDIENDD